MQLKPSRVLKTYTNGGKEKSSIARDTVLEHSKVPKVKIFPQNSHASRVDTKMEAD